MKKEQLEVISKKQKKVWQKPSVVELDISLTQGGSVPGHVESWEAPNGNLYGGKS